jgi:hypothetical protein
MVQADGMGGRPGGEISNDACRTFGPAVRFGDNSLAVCELCYRGASDEQIAACEVEVDPEDLQSALLREIEKSAPTRQTIVAFALAGVRLDAPHQTARS